MIPSEGFTGHSVGDADGVILSADASVCDLLQRSARELVGLSYLQITHPDDRAANARMLAALPVGQAPIVIRKRYLRADGSAVPVELSVSRFSQGERAGRLVGTICWGAPVAAPTDGLWRIARDVEALNRLRQKLFGADLFPDHPMAILLRIYLAELEGRTISAAQLAEELGIPPTLATRWLAALTAYGLLDLAKDAAAPRQLSNSGVARLEHLLRAAGQAVTGTGGPY